VAFVLGGLASVALLFGWAKGSPMRRNAPYSFSMSFREASKLDVGTPVRMKGVQIGTVTRVVLSPSHITGGRWHVYDWWGGRRGGCICLWCLLVCHTATHECL
jgi:hypothetical protein